MPSKSFVRSTIDFSSRFSAKIKDETTNMANSSMKSSKIMDETGKIGNSSRIMAKNMDETRRGYEIPE